MGGARKQMLSQSCGVFGITMISMSTAPPPDARSPSTRQAIFGFMGRRGRSATTGTPVSPSPVDHGLHLHLPSLHHTEPSRLGGILRRRGEPSPQESTTTGKLYYIVLSCIYGSGGPTHRLRLVPHLDPSARTLHFEPIVRDVRAGGAVLRIGRFTDRVGASE